jgi:hypothetical protein
MKWGGKKLTKKVKAIIKSDVIGSVALVSVLLNVFFFSGVVLFNATNELDVSVYEASVRNLCNDNYDSNLQDEMERASDPARAKANFEIVCRSGEFSRYFENAVEAYKASTL